MDGFRFFRRSVPETNSCPRRFSIIAYTFYHTLHPISHNLLGSAKTSVIPQSCLLCWRATTHGERGTHTTFVSTPFKMQFAGRCLWSHKTMMRALRKTQCHSRNSLSGERKYHSSKAEMTKLDRVLALLCCANEFKQIYFDSLCLRLPFPYLTLLDCAAVR